MTTLGPGVMRFVPPPRLSRPERFVAPADDGTPHPLALHAALLVMATLADDPELVGAPDFMAPGAGKMFGVLVVADDADQLGILRGFSGMIGRRWVIPGFVPPLFDVAALEAFWPAGEAELDAMTRSIAACRARGDVDEQRRLELERSERSRALWGRIQRTYRVADRAGHVCTIAELFAPGVPPSGAGDCAGPKLVGAAHRQGLRPLALAELWWGAPLGGRVHGSFHAPCTRKCGPVLAHMLRGC